jgi:acetolactate synthase-1/2/3 large subunit
MRNGGNLLMESLVALGACKGFGVPGESYLAVLDAMLEVKDQFELVLCRNEGGAAFMAAAWGKLTGTPGLCFVTRGPGASNAVIGVHTAKQDSSPMILFVGQVGTGMRGREAFQEIDYTTMFGSFAKWVAEIDHADRIPEVLSRAWIMAQSGRPGPVVIALPEDMLMQLTAVAPLAGPTDLAEPAADAAVVDRALALLGRAERPVILLGSNNWPAPARKALQVFAEVSDIPVVAAFRCQDMFDNQSPCYAGDLGFTPTPAIRKTIANADVVLALNNRFGEVSTQGYTLFEVPVAAQNIIHVHGSVDEIGKVQRPTIGIVAGPQAIASALRPVQGNWSDWRRRARAAYEDSFHLPSQPSPVDMVRVTAHLRDVLPKDAILTNGAGNFAIWPSKFLPFGPEGRLLAPQSGAMGYGVPAAIAAKVAFPQRTVVCFAGDGDFQMTLQELATAKQAGAQPVILILNNGTYGTIRAHQEWHYPGRVSGTDIENPDFVMLARSYGFLAERVDTTEAFADAFARACASATGAVLELVVSSEAITPRMSLSQIRRNALAGKENA